MAFPAHVNRHHLALAGGDCQRSVDGQDIVNVESLSSETGILAGAVQSKSSCHQDARRDSPLIG